MSSVLSHPPLRRRVMSVWFRHYRVYVKSLVSRGLPPFLEPLIFLADIGLGMREYVTSMENMPYIVFLATGLPITAAMFTASFECTFGTFIRLEFDKIYDGMLAAPISVNNLLVGEILWAGSKGLSFSLAVICVEALFGLCSLGLAVHGPASRTWSAPLPRAGSEIISPNLPPASVRPRNPPLSSPCRPSRAAPPGLV